MIKTSSLAKWLSVRLRTKWLQIWIPLLSLTIQIWRLLQVRSSLTFRQTIECGSTLKLVCRMIITYSKMHRTDKYSQRHSVIWPVWLDGWVFVDELSRCEFESCWAWIRLSLYMLFLCKQCLFWTKPHRCLLFYELTFNSCLGVAKYI